LAEDCTPTKDLFGSRVLEGWEVEREYFKFDMFGSIFRREWERSKIASPKSEFFGGEGR